MPETFHLPDDDLATISRGNCPACNCRGFVIGPQGGMSINIECANIGCRARFNVAFRSGQALAGHTISGGPEWPSEPKP